MLTAGFSVGLPTCFCLILTSLVNLSHSHNYQKFPLTPFSFVKNKTIPMKTMCTCGKYTKMTLQCKAGHMGGSRKMTLCACVYFQEHVVQCHGSAYRRHSALLRHHAEIKGSIRKLQCEIHLCRFRYVCSAHQSWSVLLIVVCFSVVTELLWEAETSQLFKLAQDFYVFSRPQELLHIIVYWRGTPPLPPQHCVVFTFTKAHL